MFKIKEQKFKKEKYYRRAGLKLRPLDKKDARPPRILEAILSKEHCRLNVRSNFFSQRVENA
jgi:hypothetical protein